MSAFIVSHDHIDALLTFAEMHRVSYYVNQALCSVPGGKQVNVTTFTATEIGAILLTENERSVRARYPDCKPGDMPGTIGEDAASYRYRVFQELFAMPKQKQCCWILNACACFDYQACETDNYEETLAHRIIESIRKAAIRAVPGYDSAPWEINRPVKVA